MLNEESTFLKIELLLRTILHGLAQEIKQAYKHVLTMIMPAEQRREALPSGNGTIGALVYGSIHQDRILFNYNELWFGGNNDEIPNMSTELPVAQQYFL